VTAIPGGSPLRQRAGRVLAYLVLALIGLIGIAPFAVLIVLSFKRRIDILTVPPTLDFELPVVMANYTNVMFERGFLTYIWNSVLVTSFSVGIALALGIPAAYAFSRIPIKGGDRWATTILSFRFMPPVAVAIPIFLMIRSIGLLDTRIGLTIPYIAFSLPLVIWIMIGFFDEVPRDIDDAARVDGCSRLTALRHVMVPLVKPGVAVAAIFSAIFIWNEFMVGLYLINAQSNKTIPLGAAGLISAQRPIDWNIAATVGVVTILPLFLFSFFIQRYIVRGMTSGAVK
jgi:multiple sugar transport system permease protein